MARESSGTTYQKMKIIIKKMKKTAEKASSSAQTVASIDDLLVEILLRLPMKSLIRFKFVSKNWLSVITNPQFALRRNPNPNPALGLFLPCTAFRVNPKFDYIPFDAHNPSTPPFKKLKFTKDPSGIHIVQSCNGLLLCSSARAPHSKRNYYVYNPITKQRTTLPKPRPEPGGTRKVLHGVALAFDPAKSPHYKVVCVRDSEMDPSKYQIEIYSSEAGPWRASGGPFMADINFETAVYWNRAVHWISKWGNMTSMCFNVDSERLAVMPMPPIPDDWGSGRSVTYFGESCDHLHLIEIYGPQSQFSVYEMKRDYSEWFVKYHVDLEAIGTAFPGMVGRFTGDFTYYSFSIFSLIRGEREEDAFLVLQIPGKAIRYNLASRTLEKLCDFEGADEEHYLRFSETTLAHQFIESLCCV